MKTQQDKIGEALHQAAAAIEGAKRFHADVLGAGVNPEKCFADFLLRIARGDDAGLEKVYGSVRTKAALAESGGTSGGYLVPTELRLSLLQSVTELAIFRPRAFVQPMASATLQLPLPDATTPQAAGTSPFFGGVLMQWLTEAAALQETEPTFTLVELKAWELSGYALASNVLMQDVGGLDAFLRRLFAQAVAWYEDFAFFQGNGVGKPQGIIPSGAALTVPRSSGSTFKLVDAAKMAAKLLPSSWPRAIWAMHPSVIVQTGQLDGGSSVVTWVPNVVGPPLGVLFGLPVIVTEKVATLGTKGDVVLFDPLLYVIGDRQAVEIDVSPHVNFLKNQTTWRITERVDGQPWFSSPITLQDAATGVSPIVVLN